MSEYVKDSPWGRVQHATKICDGMWFVHTASHGGVYVSNNRLARMPVEMRETAYSHGGFFEEDCDWCLPFLVFEDDIMAGEDEHSKEIVREGRHRKHVQHQGPLMRQFIAQRFFVEEAECG